MHPEVPLIMKLENNGYPLGIRWLENTVDTTPLSYVKTAQVEEEPGFSPIPDIYDLKDTGLPKSQLEKSRSWTDRSSKVPPLWLLFWSQLFHDHIGASDNLWISIEIGLPMAPFPTSSLAFAN